MLGYQPHRGKVNFFRQVVISPQVSREDMDFPKDEIDPPGGGKGVAVALGPPRGTGPAP